MHTGLFLAWFSTVNVQFISNRTSTYHITYIAITGIHTIEMGGSIKELDSKLAVSGEELQRIKHYKVNKRIQLYNY